MTAIVLQFDAYKKSHVPSKPVVVDLAELSFVRDLKVGRNFWAVEPSGDYAADCQTGRKLALEYLQYITKSGLPLSWIVRDMRRQEINGTQLGFFGGLEQAAGYGALCAGASLPELLKLPN